jgi:CRP-like cAMP-binding protein
VVQVVFEAGETIMRYGETGDSMFILKEGSAEVLVGDKVVHTFAPGGYFGEIALVLADCKRTATIRVCMGGRATCLRIDRVPFDAIMQAGAVRKTVMTRVDEVMQGLPPERVAETFVRMKQPRGERPHWPTFPPRPPWPGSPWLGPPVDLT